MEEYKCKIATKEELIKKHDYEIAKHPNDQKWEEFKKISLNNFNTRVTYIGLLNDDIITEATAIISNDDLDMQNKENLIGKDIAYLTGFRTTKEYEGKGYFSKLYKFMENDLKQRGFKKLTLGVEPSEVRNIQIYFNWGYTNYIKSDYEKYPEVEEKEPEKILVNYYSKKI
ncbi:MAG: GNAT family N-acetyltransferase [Bacilli bacterium]|nr:GNAT family N-acetyltransferase [Bacilli bacterium]